MTQRWTVDESCAVLKGTAWTATVDISRPSAGLHRVQCGSSEGLDRILGIELPGDVTVRTHHIRQDDLVAGYELAALALEPEIYWRYVTTEVEGQRLEGCEVLVSFQTDRLDARPHLTVTTDVAAESVMAIPKGADAAPASFEDMLRQGPSTVHLWRCQGSDYSVLQLADPSDVIGAQLAPRDGQDGWCCSLRLLQEHLEKGVIRRVRLAAWFLPKANDQAIARTLYEQFLAAPPPLTT